MGVKHHRKIYKLCNGLCQQKPQDTDTCCRSNSIRTRLHLPPPLSSVQPSKKKKEDKLNDLDSGVGNGQKTIQRNTKINFAVKPISFFFFFLPFLFFSHLFIESTAHYSSSFYHYYFRFLFVRDVEEENEDLKKTTKK